MPPAAPSPRRRVDDDDDDGDDDSLTRECSKLLLIVGFIVAIVFAGQEIGDALLTTRGFLRTHVPLYAFLPALVAVNGFRRLLPPAFYVVPVGTLSLLYLVSALGWARGALVYQALKLADVGWFLLIRRWYSAPAAALLEGDRGARGRARRWLPRDVEKLLRILDARWAGLIAPPGVLHRRLGTVALLGAAWATDEMVTLYFLATRCALDVPFFAAAWAGVLVTTTPEVLVKARAVVGFVNAASESDWGVLARALRTTPPWLLASFAVVSGGATLVVHGVHLRLIWDEAPDDDRAVELPSRAVRDDAEDREKRRAEVLAAQRRGLDDGGYL